VGKSAQRRASNREHDARRRQEQPWRAWYKDPRWVQGRLQHLSEHPLCAMCALVGHVCAATVVDHIRPHRGDEELFFDRTNWQSLCATCHDIRKQRAEARGYTDMLDDDGWPSDPNHPANAHVRATVAARAGIGDPTPRSKSLGPLPSGPAPTKRAQRRENQGRGSDFAEISRAVDRADVE
jgi:5-methylcytosine-specific restriction protein A